MKILFIASGSFIGAVIRAYISKRLNASIPKFPYGTLIVNLLGSFLLGWLVGHEVKDFWLLLLGIGFCGSFTTFSTLQWEAVQLFQLKNRSKMFLYLGITYILGIGAATIGFLIGKM